MYVEELVATSSDIVRIYKVQTQNLDEPFVTPVVELCNNSEFNGPISSFDWNPHNVNCIATCSIDNTVSILDIPTHQVSTQLIAHDSPVYDIAFAEDSRFGTVGQDGSVRVFDLRQLESSTIIFETNQQSLYKIAWNQKNQHQLAVLAENSNEVLVLDQRKPN